MTVEPDVTPKEHIGYGIGKKTLRPHVFQGRATVSFPIKQLPFATKSVVCTHGVELKQRGNEELERVDILSVFKTCGAQLTSLSLNPVTLLFKTLIGILSQTPNLKAFHVSNLTICDPTSFEAPLPPLPHLNTILLNGVDAFFGHGKTGQRRSGTVTNLIFEPYLNQLITLENSENPRISAPPPPLKVPQGNLRQLKVDNPRRNFLLESEPAPQLQRLSLLNSTTF